jgi:3-hydroxyisobutyrate dehydrogenase-like beta-hydroxyacid dehydrogenase
MGLPMASHLVEAGFDVTAWARRPEVRDAATAAGLTMVDTVGELGAERDAVITVVTTSSDVSELASPLLAAMKPGSVLVDMSTISPATSRAVAAQASRRGVDFLDAPVSGGSFGAEAGTLTIMVGGDGGVLERCRPLFNAMGDPQRVFHTGPVGSGEVVKLVNNMLVGTISAATLEALMVGVRAGVPAATLVEVVSVSSGGSTQLTGQLARRALVGNFDPGFKTDLLVKDLELAQQLAEAVYQPTPFADQALDLFERARAAGHGDRDYTSLLLVLEREAGVTARLE